MFEIINCKFIWILLSIIDSQTYILHNQSNSVRIIYCVNTKIIYSNNVIFKELYRYTVVINDIFITNQLSLYK